VTLALEGGSGHGSFNPDKIFPDIHCKGPRPRPSLDSWERDKYVLPSIESNTPSLSPFLTHFVECAIRPDGPEGGGGRVVALLFLDLGARRGGWSAPRPGRFTPGKDPVPIVQEAGWAPGSV
jgi:hypothetical protein